MIKSTWSFGFENIRSELSMENSLSIESSFVRRLFKMFSGHAVEVVINLVTETMVEVYQSYESHEFVLAVTQSGLVPGGIVSRFKGYNKQKNIILIHSCCGNHCSASFCMRGI